MMLTLKAEHKIHLQFLAEQPVQVLQDFCRLALDYLRKGPNPKIYGAAAQKLNVEPRTIQNSAEGLINLMLECTKHKSSPDDLKKILVDLGFVEEKESLITQLYISKQSEISEALSNTGFKLPRYHNMEWRFEVQIASRSLSSQVVPMVTLDFDLKNAENSNDTQHILLQTDPTNLLHMAQELESAIQEGHSQHIRRIKRTIK